MQYVRMPIEIESPEEMGYENIENNLAESSVRDRSMGDLSADLGGLVLNYGDHRGLYDLRKLICENSTILKIEDVLVCQAAAMSLFIVNTSLLSADDHLIVIRPNYATNIETPKAIGSEISYIDLSFENGYQVDIQQIEQSIKPNTKLISLTSPHNPTGILINPNSIDSLIKIIETKGIYLLIDETYRELNFQTELPTYYAEKSENIISVSSLSKAYGFPGLRMGWIISKNKKLQNIFLAAKEQIIICNSVIDEYLAKLVLENRTVFLSESHKTVNENFEIMKTWLQNHKYLEWQMPVAGAVGFPRFKENIQINFVEFYKILFIKFKTIVGPGHWFEQSDRYFRLGFGYPTANELNKGLKAIDEVIKLLLA